MASSKIIDISLKNAVKYGHLSNVKKYVDLIDNADDLGEFLVLAARSAKTDIEMLRTLITAGADPNYFETQTIGEHVYYGGTPLSWAVHSGNLEKTKFLLESGATIETPKPKTGSIIHAAVNGNSDNALEMIQFLLSLGADVNIENGGDGTPLSSASREGKFEAIRLLLEAGANESELGWDQLKHAIALGSVAECEAALKSGCDINARDKYWNRTPILLCALTGDTKKADLLFHHGASLTDRGRCEATCLMHAVRKNNHKMCEWLLSNGVDINETDDFGTTALIEAAEFGAAECVEVLLNAGADLNSETETQGCAIENAANFKTALILKNAGADINRIGGDGYNVLLHATEQEDYDFVKGLLEIGADPNVTSTGNIPLHKAAWNDEIEILKLLLKYHSNPNALDVDDETPLHRVKSVEAAQILMQTGAKPNIKNIVGQIALDYAENDHIRTVMHSTFY